MDEPFDSAVVEAMLVINNTQNAAGLSRLWSSHLEEEPNGGPTSDITELVRLTWSTPVFSCHPCSGPSTRGEICRRGSTKIRANSVRGYAQDNDGGYILQSVRPSESRIT